MADNFPDCLNFVLAEEGPETNDPNDPGGHTKFGISKRAFPELDIGSLTRDQAAGIYRGHYWTPCRCEELAKPLALCVFDAAVNMGNAMAVRLLQAIVDVTEDGIMGPMTLLAVKGADVAATVKNYHAERESQYRSMMGFFRYGHGWLNRNDSCERLALSWLGGSNDPSGS